MKPAGGGWFRLDSDGLVCLFNSYSLTPMFFRSGEEVPGPEDLPCDIPPPAVPPPTPGTLQAVVTTRCNLACRYCSVSGNPCVRAGTGEMEEDTLTRVIEASSGASLLAVTGGEPLLARNKTFRLLEESSCGKLLFTNGTLLDRAAACRLKAAGVMLIISMDGPAELHDSVRILPGGGGTWALAAEGIRIASGEGLEFGISLVMRGHNVDHAGEIFDRLFDEFHPASFGVNMLHFTERGFDPPPPSRCTGMLLEAFRFARRRGVFVDQVARRLSPLVRRIPRFRDCEALSGKMVVFPDGTESCCVNWLGAGGPPPSWDRRIPLLSEECSSCPAICICGGGCAWDGENLCGPGRMDRRNCVWTLAFLEEALLDIGRSLPGRSPDPGEMLSLYGSLVSNPGTIRSSIGHS